MKNSATKSKPSRFFEPLAIAVGAGAKVREAAVTAGCSESLAYHISATRDFRLRVSVIRSEITAEAIGVLTRGAALAATTLVELLGAENEPKDRLNAAKAILSSLGPITDTHESRNRLNELEQSQPWRK